MCATAVFCSAEAFAQAQKSDKDLKKELKERVDRDCKKEDRKSVV